MTTTTRDLGDRVRITATFTSLDDINTDPTTITFKMVEPDGTETSYVYGTDIELVRLSGGVFYVDWTTDQPGRHRYRFIGTGTVEQTVGGDLYAKRDETA